MSDPDLIVVGAGLTGLTIARLAAEADKRVLLLERRPHLGGNAYSYTDADTGLQVHKYGMHIFHTNSDKVWNFVRRFHTWVPYEHRVWAKTARGTLAPLPFSRATYSALQNKYVTWDEPRSLSLDLPTTSDFERAAVGRVGRDAYAQLIYHYHHKQWGPWADSISPGVIARLPVRQNLDTRYFSDKHQGLPRHGYGELAIDMVGSHPRITVRLGLGSSIGPADLDEWIRKFPDVKVVWTGTTDQLLGREKTDQLPWRGLTWEKWTGPTHRGLGAAVVNDCTDAMEYTRRYDWSYLPHERRLVKPWGSSLQTVVTTEFPCEPTTDDQKAYPIPAEASRRNFKAHESLVRHRFGDQVILAGRLGTYQYLNMDQAIAQGMSIWEKQLNVPPQAPSTSTSSEDPPATTSA